MAQIHQPSYHNSIKHSVWAAPQSKSAHMVVSRDWCGKTVAGGVKEHCHSIILTPGHIIHVGHFNWALSMKCPRRLRIHKVLRWVFFFFPAACLVSALQTCITTAWQEGECRALRRDGIKWRWMADKMLAQGKNVNLWNSKENSPRKAADFLQIFRLQPCRLVVKTSYLSRFRPVPIWPDQLVSFEEIEVRARRRVQLW